VFPVCVMIGRLRERFRGGAPRRGRGGGWCLPWCCRPGERQDRTDRQTDRHAAMPVCCSPHLMHRQNCLSVYTVQTHTDTLPVCCSPPHEAPEQSVCLYSDRHSPTVSVAVASTLSWRNKGQPKRVNTPPCSVWHERPSSLSPAWHPFSNRLLFVVF